MRYEWSAQSSHDQEVERLVRNAPLPAAFFGGFHDGKDAVSCVRNAAFDHFFDVEHVTDRVMDGITRSAMLDHVWLPCDEDLDNWSCFRILRLHRNSFVMIQAPTEHDGRSVTGIETLLNRFRSLVEPESVKTVTALTSQVEFERKLEHDIAKVNIFRSRMTLLHIRVGQSSSSQRTESFFREVQALLPLDGRCYRHLSGSRVGISIVSGWTPEDALLTVQGLATRHFHDPDLRFTCGLARRKTGECIGDWVDRALTQMASPWDDRLQSQVLPSHAEHSANRTFAPLATQLHEFPVCSVVSLSSHERAEDERMVLTAFDETLFLINTLLLEIGRSPRNPQFVPGSWMSQFIVFLSQFMEREEQHMVRMSYPDVPRHRLLHQGLLATARRIESQLYRRAPGAERQLVWFVVEQVLGTHFAREDAPYYEWMAHPDQANSVRSVIDPSIDQKSA